jgi:hypothetical protein
MMTYLPPGLRPPTTPKAPPREYPFSALKTKRIK